jgi:hypothetical protein
MDAFCNQISAVLTGKKPLLRRKNLYHAFGSADVPLELVADQFLSTAHSKDKRVIGLTCYPVASRRLPHAINLFDVLNLIGLSRDVSCHNPKKDLPAFDPDSEWYVSGI